MKLKSLILLLLFALTVSVPTFAGSNGDGKSKMCSLFRVINNGSSNKKKSTSGNGGNVMENQNDVKKVDDKVNLKDIKLVGVYDANGGFTGELQYIFEKVFYKKDCALCDITHGLSFSAKKEWVELANSFPVSIETLHLNEITPEMKKLVTGHTPCIVYTDKNKMEILVNTQELKSCQSDPKKLFTLLREKLNLNEEK